MSSMFFQIGSVTIMDWTGAHGSFAVETFLRIVNMYLLHSELFVLISCYVGMMLFLVEFSSQTSIDFL